MNRKLGRSSLFVAATLFFLLALPHPTLAQTPLFNPQTEYVAGTNIGVSSIVVGDFNGDGKPDLAVVNYGDGSAWVLLGNGDGTFQPARNIFLTGGGNTLWYIAEGDFNADGKLDLAVTNLTNNIVMVLLGNGDGTFRTAPSFAGGNIPAVVAVGDFNGDGKPDLVVANFNDSTLSVLLGNGDGTFQAAQTFGGVGTHPQFVAVGDFNRDGKLDLVVTNSHSNSVSVLLGNGDGTFQPAQNFAVDSDPVYVTVGDFNGTGVQDLAVANLHSIMVSVLLGNAGTGSTVVATPTFTPAGGTYTGSVTVSISDATSGATIHYTTDGSTPTTSSPVYSGALTFTQTTTLNAMAAAPGMTDSAVASATYTIQQQQVATPTFSPGGGTYTGSVTVSISDATSGATIHYTTDGSTPTTSSPVYGGALTFTQTTTLNAMAAATGMTDSAVASATYTVPQPVATPALRPGGGTYTGLVTVSISDATGGATIYYTTDGSTPTTSSAVYTGALTFTQTTTLKAMAAASGMTNSGVASATYTMQQSFTLTVSKTDLGDGTVTSSPAGINCGSTCSATYVSGTTVTLTATPDVLSGFGGGGGWDSGSGKTCTRNINSA